MIKLRHIISILALSSIIPIANASFFSPLACKVNREAPVSLDVAKNLNPKVLNLALKAYECAQKLG